jgi:hypothetical protein
MHNIEIQYPQSIFNKRTCQSSETETERMLKIYRDSGNKVALLTICSLALITVCCLSLLTIC